jgi:hypothetical protein
METSGEPSQELEPLPDWVMIWFGYFCAVTATTVSFLLEASFENPLTPAADVVWDRLTIVAVVGQVFWFVAFFAALPLFAAACVIARRLKIRSVFYYGAWGAVTGLVLTPVAQWLTPADEAVRSFVQDIMFLAPKFMFYGLCGALAYWYVAGRRLGLGRHTI